MTRPYVLITGSRRWRSFTAIRNTLAQLRELLGEFTVVQGGARGADLYAELAARVLGLPDPITVKAEWDRYGRAAGPIRNIEMLEMGPVYVVGFWVHGSTGTAHTLTNAINKYRIPTLVITEEDDDDNPSAVQNQVPDVWHPDTGNQQTQMPGV